MVIDAHVYHWTPAGMVRRATTHNGWIAVHEVERLLEEAHAKGKREGRQEAYNEYKVPTGM